MLWKVLIWFPSRASSLGEDEMQHRAVGKQDYHFMYVFYIILPLVTYIKLLFAMLETSVYFFQHANSTPVKLIG